MKYGIREEEESDCEADSHKWSIKIENEIQSLRNQIALLRCKFLQNSNRLSQLESANAQKEVGAKISAVDFHRNARHLEFTPKRYACQRYPGTLKEETGQCPSDGFCKPQAQTEYHTSFNVFGQTFPNDIYTTPISTSSTTPKPFGNNLASYTSVKFPDLTQERILIELLNQIGKIESKMNEMSDRFTSVQSQLNEVSSRLSFVDSRMSSVDLFLTMQRYNQKWQDLMPTIDNIAATENPLDQDVKLKRGDLDCRCTKNGSSTVSDQVMVPSCDACDLARDCLIQFKETQKVACQTERAMDEIKMPIKDPCPAFFNTSNLNKPMLGVESTKLAKSTNVFIETAETKSSSNFLVQDSGMRTEANSVGSGIDMPNGNVGKGEGNLGECIKQITNTAEKDNNRNRISDGNRNTEIALTHMKVQTAQPTSKDTTCYKIQEIHQPKENICQPSQDFGVDHTGELEHRQTTDRVQIQTASPAEYGINSAEAKGDRGEDLENIMTPLLFEESGIKDGKKTPSPGGDGENESLIVTKLDELEKTKPSTTLANRERINICRDILEGIFHGV